MSSNMSIPIPIQHVAGVEDSVAEVREAIEKCAYERFINRGAAAGFALEDWISAETDLIVMSTAESHIENNQVVVEIVMANVDASLLTVIVSPREMLVSSAPDGSGRRVFQKLHFQEEIDPSGTEAEYVLDTLFVVSPIANKVGLNRASMQVA